MRSSTFHLWPWLVPSRLHVTRTAGARRFPPSHDIPRSTRERLWETTGMSQPFESSTQTQSFLSGQQRSSLPHSPFPFGEECCVTRQNRLRGRQASEWQVRCESARKGKWTSAAHNKNHQLRRLFELCHTFVKTSYTVVFFSSCILAITLCYRIWSNVKVMVQFLLQFPWRNLSLFANI